MTITRTFDAADLGTREDTWLLDGRWDDVPAVPPEQLLDEVSDVLVLAAHPDDESLGCGGVVAAAGRAGLPLRVIVATDGERSHPHATAWSADHLRAARRAEAAVATEQLGPAATLHLLGLPDGQVAHHEDDLLVAARPFVGPETVVLAPWRSDGHPDHEAVGRVAARLGARLWEYPLWAWHWGGPDDLPWERLRQVPLDVGLVATKRLAIDAHGSQVGALGPGPGDRPLVGAHVRARFERLVETYVVGADDPVPLPRASERQATFDDLSAGDPWQLDGWYERRKRAVVTAALRRERYRRVLDIGCGTGDLTALLAQRAEQVVGVDVSAVALERTRARVPGEGVDLHHGELPGVLDEVGGPLFDLVVISEVGYFLRGDEWLTTLRGARRLLAEGGELVLVHWRHPTREIPLDGRLATEQAIAMLDLPLRVRLEDDDFLLTVHGGLSLDPRGQS